MKILLRLWRTIASPVAILWLLVVVLMLAVIIVSREWNLEKEQVVGISIAALAIPFAFLSQRAILKENQKQKLRIDAYENLQIPLNGVKDSLIGFKVSSLGSMYTLSEHSMQIKQATANLMYAYNTYEMVLIKDSNYFKYIYLLLDKLSRELDHIRTVSNKDSEGGIIEYVGEDAADLIDYHKAKELADDINMYIYDLKKECIESMGFDKLFGIPVEKRVPGDKKYKTLPEVATKKAIDLLKIELEGSE